MVMDALRAYASLASGLTEVPRERAAALAKTLLDQGGQAAGAALPMARQVQDLTEGLLAASRTNREALLSLVRSEAGAAVGGLEQRVVDLEAQVASLIVQVPMPHLPRTHAASPPAAAGGSATRPGSTPSPAVTSAVRAATAPAGTASTTPGTKRVTKPATQPGTKPATKPATRSATKPAVKRATKPAVQRPTTATRPAPSAPPSAPEAAPAAAPAAAPSGPDGTATE